VSGPPAVTVERSRVPVGYCRGISLFRGQQNQSLL
jgi:hypothetical protein